jgi:cell division protein FtsN
MMKRKLLPILSILTIAIVLTPVIITLIEFGTVISAQAQGNASTLTPQQKDAICNPNNPLAKLTPVNTTESKLCGIPKTVKPHLTSSNMTTGAQAPLSSSAATSMAPSASPPS